MLIVVGKGRPRSDFVPFAYGDYANGILDLTMTAIKGPHTFYGIFPDLHRLTKSADKTYLIVGRDVRPPPSATLSALINSLGENAEVETISETSAVISSKISHKRVRVEIRDPMGNDEVIHVYSVESKITNDKPTNRAISELPEAVTPKPVKSYPYEFGEIIVSGFTKPIILTNHAAKRLYERFQRRNFKNRIQKRGFENFEIALGIASTIGRNRLVASTYLRNLKIDLVLVIVHKPGFHMIVTAYHYKKASGRLRSLKWKKFDIDEFNSA